MNNVSKLMESAVRRLDSGALAAAAGGLAAYQSIRLLLENNFPAAWPVAGSLVTAVGAAAAVACCQKGFFGENLTQLKYAVRAVPAAAGSIAVAACGAALAGENPACGAIIGVAACFFGKIAAGKTKSGRGRM